MGGYIRIHPADNVAVALEPLPEGFSIEVPSANDGVLHVTLLQDVPAGHKIALKDFSAGENVIKYGSPIGHVICDIVKGGCIDHNCLKTNLDGLIDYKYEPDLTETARVRNVRTFKGFRRPSGKVGIRNEIWIIPTVGCVNGVAKAIAERLTQEKAGQMGSVDAIVAFPHNYGCSQLGDDHQNTRKILADMVRHPNAGGILIVALGCENNQLGPFMGLVGEVDSSRVKTIEVQKVDGDETEAGLELARSIFASCCNDERTEVPVSELKVGLKCGGSDGLSGITANPLLGKFSDWIVAQGGTAVLTEVPEMFGAETILMNRCQDTDTFNKTVKLVNDFKEYFIKNGQPIYENPSPGNKAGGISTLEEKSLGCTQKCGNSIVRDVISYGDMLSVKGLNLLSAPGNDLVASTALAAAGCQIVLFTTGRGTPFGSFVPTMKISTNSSLAGRKPGWMDFNAGVIAEGVPMDEAAGHFIDYVMDIVNGAPVRNEINSIREISIFKTGVTL